MFLPQYLYDRAGSYDSDSASIWSRIGLGYRSYCNREPPQQPVPPFTGGQCPGVAYTVTWYWHAKNLFGNPFNYDSTTSPLAGGIGQIESLPNPDAPGGYIVRIPYNIGNGPTQYYICASTGNSQAPFTNITYGITNVQPPAGTADNCGNPPPPALPAPNPGDRTVPFNFTYTDNSNNSVNVTATITAAPIIVSANGILYAPVKFNFNFNPKLEIDGLIRLDNADVQINFGDSGRLNPRDPSSPNQPTLPPGVPDYPPDMQPGTPERDPEKPTDRSVRLMIGCLVTVESYGPEQSLILQNTNPDIALARFGNISFLCDINGKSAWTTDIPIRNQRQVVPCPWEGGAIRIGDTPNKGVVWSVIPIYANKTPTIKFS